MQVDIIAMTPRPVDILYVAARTCKSDRTPQELMFDEVSVEEKVRLLSKLWEKEHLSIFEHVSITYAISGISRSCLVQLTRHRIGVSPSVSSQRRRLDVSYVVPSSVANDARWKRYLGLCTEFYQLMVKEGYPPEDVRFALPNAVATNLVLTVNLRSLGDLYKKRALNPAAQWEIRGLIQKMVQLVVDKIPEFEFIKGGK